jgi:four helix bundle protein
MDSEKKKQEMRQRTKLFAKSVVHLFTALDRRNEEIRILGRQMLRAGTSVGANYREASRARGDAEFIAKIELCVQEADQTQYWLELLQESCCVPESQAAPIWKEANELVSIFITMAKNTKKISPQKTQVSSLPPSLSELWRTGSPPEPPELSQIQLIIRSQKPADRGRRPESKRNYSAQNYSAKNPTSTKSKHLLRSRAPLARGRKRGTKNQEPQRPEAGGQKANEIILPKIILRKTDAKPRELHRTQPDSCPFVCIRGSPKPPQARTPLARSRSPELRTKN